jgi:hypothetical protein
MATFQRMSLTMVTRRNRNSQIRPREDHRLPFRVSGKNNCGIFPKIRPASEIPV